MEKETEKGGKGSTGKAANSFAWGKRIGKRNH